MLRDKKNIIIISTVLFISILSLTIAFSALSSNLSLRFGNLTQTVQSWNIGIVEETVTGVATGADTQYIDCGSATVNSISISGLQPKLSAPGDRCAYSFKIKNSGTITGKINQIEVVPPGGEECTITGSTMVCTDITYKLHYTSATSTSLVAVNDTIAGNTTKTVVLTAEYTGSEAQEWDFHHFGMQWKLSFTQK